MTGMGPDRCHDNRLINPLSAASDSKTVDAAIVRKLDRKQSMQQSCAHIHVLQGCSDSPLEKRLSEILFPDLVRLDVALLGKARFRCIVQLELIFDTALIFNVTWVGFHFPGGMLALGVLAACSPALEATWAFPTHRKYANL